MACECCVRTYVLQARIRGSNRESLVFFFSSWLETKCYPSCSALSIVCIYERLLGGKIKTDDVARPPGYGGGKWNGGNSNKRNEEPRQRQRE